MKEQVIFAGFGGQGVILGGKILCLAAMKKGLFVTHMPAYGAEMRGGTANCSLVISDEPIGSPLVPEPSTLIALNLPSYNKFQEKLAPGGLLIYNSSLISPEEPRKDVTLCPVAANEIAEATGNKRAVNMAAIGAFLMHKPFLDFSDIENALDEAISARNRKHNPVNMAVVKAAYNSL